MLRLNVNRREFLKITAGAGAALAMPTSGHTAVPSKMIGIQVGAVSFVDEGTEKVLDELQERACVNTLFLAVFTYGRGIAGRQIPGQPLPDHGKQEYDLNFHGGNFATPHPLVLQEFGSQRRSRPRPRRSGYPGRSSTRGEKAWHEGHLLDGGRVPQ